MNVIIPLLCLMIGGIVGVFTIALVSYERSECGYYEWIVENGKDGTNTFWVCPVCGDTYMLQYTEYPEIRRIYYCSQCGERLVTSKKMKEKCGYWETTV